MNTAVTIAGVTFQNPVMTGSGTFGSGMESVSYTHPTLPTILRV